MKRLALLACFSLCFVLAVRSQVRTTEDTLQDDHIDQINRHLDHTDKTVEEQGRQIDEAAVNVASMRSDLAAVRSDVDGSQNENRGWFGGVLLAIGGGTITIRAARKKSE